MMIAANMTGISTIAYKPAHEAFRPDGLTRVQAVEHGVHGCQMGLAGPQGTVNLVYDALLASGQAHLKLTSSQPRLLRRNDRGGGDHRLPALTHSKRTGWVRYQAAHGMVSVV